MLAGEVTVVAVSVELKKFKTDKNAYKQITEMQLVVRHLASAETRDSNGTANWTLAS